MKLPPPTQGGSFICHLHHDGQRRYGRGAYILLYQIEGGAITVIAVRHSKFSGYKLKRALSSTDLPRVPTHGRKMRMNARRAVGALGQNTAFHPITETV